MRVDKKLRLVLPLVEGDGKDRRIRGYVHSEAISSDVFRAFYKPMGRALASIYRDQIGLMGARLAHLALRDAAVELGMWEGDSGVERGLMAEIRRLTTLMIPGKSGWESVPFENGRKDLSPDEVDEVEGALVYFILASSLHRRAEAEAIINSSSNLWGARTESSSSTEFLNSLRTSRETENSGETVAA